MSRCGPAPVLAPFKQIHRPTARRCSTCCWRGRPGFNGWLQGSRLASSAPLHYCRWLLISPSPSFSHQQAEDKDGETPLGAAVPHGKLRDGLAAIAKGEKTLDDFMLD